MIRVFRSLVAAFALLAMALPAQAIPVKQLGFLLDSSGSISTADYNKVRNGLNAALAALPDGGSVEITVVRFSSGTSVVVPPTLLTAASLSGIQFRISSHSKNGGQTNTAAGINTITAQMTLNSAFFDASDSRQSFINITTDGSPNRPNGSTQAQAAAVAAAQAANLAGIDSLSAEVIGRGANGTSLQNNALALAFPGPATILAMNSTTIPNPLNGSWIVPVTNYDTYAAVIGAKTQAIVTDVPEPGMLALAGIGVLGMFFTRRRKARPV